MVLRKTISIFVFFLVTPFVVHAEDQTLKVNYADAYPPLSFGSIQNVKGILPELMDILITDKMSLPIEHRGKA